MMTARRLAALPLALALAVATPVAAAPSTLAITGGTLIDAYGKRHPDTTILVSGNQITAVGVKAVPAGARRIDAHGAWVSAGLFDAASRVGLGELGEDDISHDALGTDDQHPVQAGLRIADGFYPAATAIPVTRVAGVTTAALVPDGGLLSGQGAVVDLAGPSPAVDATIVRRTVGQFGSIAPDEAHLPGEAARARIFAALREVFAMGRAPRLPLGDRLPMRMGLGDYEAVRALATGRVPLYLRAHRASDILAAIAFAREVQVPLVIMGAEEGWLVADQLAAARVPVVLNPFADLPEAMQMRGSRLDNAALLDKAGVDVAIGTWSGENGRNLRQAAGVAVANGLPWESAWRAVTAVPATIYGCGRTHGNVTPGRVADLVVWEGDPFEPATAVRAVVVQGCVVPMETRQTALARRYRVLPGR